MDEAFHSLPPFATPRLQESIQEVLLKTYNTLCSSSGFLCYLAKTNSTRKKEDSLAGASKGIYSAGRLSQLRAPLASLQVLGVLGLHQGRATQGPTSSEETRTSQGGGGKNIPSSANCRRGMLSAFAVALLVTAACGTAGLVDATTLVAARFDGGVVIGADSRTSQGTFVANSGTDKITPVSPGVFLARSGSSAGT